MDVEQFAWIFLVLMGINLYEWLKLYFPSNPQKLPAVSNSWVDLWVHFFQQTDLRNGPTSILIWSN